MCLLIAKKHDEHGCLAVKTEPSKALASLVSYLGLKTLEKGIQILTVSDMDMYGEYNPYTIVENEAEFIARVLKM